MSDFARQVSDPDGATRETGVMERSTTWGRRARLAVRTLRRFRPDRVWLLGVLRSFVVSFLALTFALMLLPGEQVTRGTESVASLAVALLAVGALLRPLLTRITVLTGVFGLLVAGLLAQAILLGVALQLVPTVEPFSFQEVVAAAWGSAVAAAAINWLFDASSEESFLGQVLGQSVRVTQRAGVERPGLLVVQLDGVSEPLVRQAMTSGAMPTVAQWLRSGSHDLRRWSTGLPATTPAGQAVLLHGETHAIPAFRWYDKGAGRMVTSSQPDDAAAVERAFSNGRGLLADGGVSVSNLYSGDAPVRLLTMSDARIPTSDRGTASFVVSRGGFVRAVVLMVGQIITELHQGRRQRRREVVPRVRRSGSFVLLRGLTTVVLRDLNVSLVAEHMARSAPVIFVDFVDYDEVAHHAGPTRPESMRQLEGLDRVLRFFDDLADEVRSSYEIVVVSDHGQAQGVTFLQHTGRTLSQTVNELASRPVPAGAVDRPDEPWAAANVLAASAGRTTIVDRLARGSRHGKADEEAPLVVAVSGSLAHVYLTDEDGRVELGTISERYPRLTDGLVEEPAIGLVMARHEGRLRVIGRRGWRDLLDGAEVDGEGDDPLAPYGPRAVEDLTQLDTRQHVGDLVLLGRHDQVLDEVVAFEELVGSHGGLGGLQTEALLIHPRDWSVPADLRGTDVHALLVERLETLGLRTS